MKSVCIAHVIAAAAAQYPTASSTLPDHHSADLKIDNIKGILGLTGPGVTESRHHGEGFNHQLAGAHGSHCHGSSLIQLPGCTHTRNCNADFSVCTWALQREKNPACYWDETTKTGNPALRGNPNYSDTPVTASSGAAGCASGPYYGWAKN